MTNLPPSEHDLHAYVDQRLSAEDRQRVENWLANHADTAREVQAWQADAQRLRAVFGGALNLPANPGLDPLAIARQRRGRRLRYLAHAATLIMAVGLGALGGWQARGPDQRPALAATAPMTDALAAYRMFAAQGILQADYTGQAPGDLQRWLDRYFDRAQRLPDLSTAGFHPRSARLLNTDQGPAAMVVYENAVGERASFYVRPPGPGYRLLPRGSRRDGELQADYWSDPVYNYAMVSAVGLGNRGALTRAMGKDI